MNPTLLSHSLKRITILFFLMIGTLQLFSQSPKINFEAENSFTTVTVNNFESTRVQFAFEGLNYMEVKTPEGMFTELIMPGGYSLGEFGTPKLPAAKKLIEIPFGAEVSVKVLGYTTNEYKLSDFGVAHPVMPVQPSLRKDMDINEVPFEFKAEHYSKSEFIAPELATVEVLGVMRGQRLGGITIAPIQYNPASETIKVYNNIEVEIQYTGADPELTNYMKASTYSQYFNVVYDQVINPFNTRDVFDDHPDLVNHPVKMIIVSNPLFEETLQPFIEWKTIQGFEIIEAYTDEIGSSASAIQSYIQGQYADGTPEDPAPSFVVVVGAPDLLPASATGSNSGQVTDLYYGSVDGDVFPEMYVGRLSARNIQELQNQLDKILYYQQYQFDEPEYLNDVTLIAGQDSYWNPAVGQPTVNYGTENYFNTANGFTNVNAYLSSYSGAYDEERIAVSMINFTAHCSPTSWAGPYLTASDIHNLTNSNRYPVAIGNCCQSALFSHAESIGEAWMRAENKGAVAYIGSAPNTHWFEDFYWSVGAFQIQGNNNGYVPTVEETTMGTYDAAFISDYYPVASKKFVGNLAITEAHLQNYPTHSNYTYYWQAYQTFGDPSTLIYLTEGAENAVTHMPIVPIGLDIYTVEALPGSYVAVSKDGVLHGAALVGASGEVDVPIDPIVDGGDVTIVVTKPKHIPYITEVPAAALEGPFIVIDHFIINDPNGKNQANYGESFTIDLTLKNVGADPSEDVTVSISGGDQFISLQDGNDPLVFEGMDAGDTDNTSSQADAFSFEVSMDIPDQHQASFEIHITDGTEEWTSNLRITGNAPVFSINPEYILDDSVDGDGNGRLDPGETAHIIFELTNSGGAEAKNPVIELEGNSPYFIIDESELHPDPILPDNTAEVAFLVYAHSSAAEGSPVDLFVHVEDGHHDEAEAHIFIGQVPETTIGEGNATINSYYPFYNWYKANRSQMLYLADEIGEGEKTITELGMDIFHATSTAAHQALPNFKILVMHTDMNTLGSSFVNTTNASIVFDEDIHQMPAETGWHVFDIDNFEYDGTSNLLIEIIWGLLPTYCSSGDQYKVVGTEMGSTRVVYGYNDNNANPSYSGNSSVLPNLHMAFAADDTEDTKTVEFLVKDTAGNPLEEAAVSIGSLTHHTSNQGMTGFELLPGTFTFNVSKEGYQNHQDQFTIDADDIQMQVTLHSDDDPLLFGDANCDGTVDVLDVIAIVNYFLELDPQPFCFENADVNQDDSIDILDVVGTINIFTYDKLIPFPNLTSGSADAYMTPGDIMLKSDGTITALQFVITGNNAENLEMELKLPDHSMVHLREEGKLTTMIYSINNTPIPMGILSILTFGNEYSGYSWGHVIAANLNGRKVPVNTYVGPVGTDDIPLEDIIGFRTYPNPANEMLWVNFNNLSSNPVQVSLINIHGQIVQQQEITETGRTEISFNLENMLAGMYLLRLMYDDNTIIEKVMVK